MAAREIGQREGKGRGRARAVGSKSARAVGPLEQQKH